MFEIIAVYLVSEDDLFYCDIRSCLLASFVHLAANPVGDFDSVFTLKLFLDDLFLVNDFGLNCGNYFAVSSSFLMSRCVCSLAMVRDYLYSFSTVAGVELTESL